MEVLAVLVYRPVDRVPPEVLLVRPTWELSPESIVQLLATRWRSRVHAPASPEILGEALDRLGLADGGLQRLLAAMEVELANGRPTGRSGHHQGLVVALELLEVHG